MPAMEPAVIGQVSEPNVRTTFLRPRKSLSRTVLPSRARASKSGAGSPGSGPASLNAICFCNSSRVKDS